MTVGDFDRRVRVVFSGRIRLNADKVDLHRVRPIPIPVRGRCIRYSGCRGLRSDPDWLGGIIERDAER